MDTPVKTLVRMFKDQQLAITFKELRKIVKDDDFGQEVLDQWKEDYSKMLADKMTDTWKESFITGVENNNLLNGIEYSPEKEVRQWIVDRSTYLATKLSEAQHDSLKYILEESVSNKMSADETARYIRTTIGLNGPQARANLKHYNAVKEILTSEHPRMKPESIERKARESAAKYAEKQIRYRARTIAQTEIVTAYHEGSDIVMHRLHEDGLMPEYHKKWSTSLDDKVCAKCSALEGVEVAMDAPFPGDILIPPAHPRCGCAVMYVEVKKGEGK